MCLMVTWILKIQQVTNTLPQFIRYHKQPNKPESTDITLEITEISMEITEITILGSDRIGQGRVWLG